MTDKKKTKAPEAKPLPDHLEDLDVAKLALGMERKRRLDLQGQILRIEQAQAEQAQRALEEDVKERYSVGPADALYIDTGKIVRAPAPPAPPA